MGWFCFNANCVHSKEFSKYGIGLSEYFKLMKFNMAFYFGIFICGIVFFSVNLTSHNIKHTKHLMLFTKSGLL